MHACELVFDDPDDAARLVATVEEVTGQPCPCKRGQRCPLTPTQIRLVPKRPPGKDLVRHIAARAAALMAVASAGGFLRHLFDGAVALPLS